jgi:hypothetical protein
MANVQKQISVLRMIALDMEHDAEEMDGKPFDGRTIAEAFGQVRAAIASLAKITEQHLTEKES